MDTRRAVSFMMRSRLLNAEQFGESRQILRHRLPSTRTPPSCSTRSTSLMNTTVGFININQNKIIKIFSVASVALLPHDRHELRYMPESWTPPQDLAAWC